MHSLHQGCNQWLSEGGGGGGQGGNSPLFLFFFCLSAQRSVMAMMIPHYENFSWKCFSPPPPPQSNTLTPPLGVTQSNTQNCCHLNGKTYLPPDGDTLRGNTFYILYLFNMGWVFLVTRHMLRRLCSADNCSAKMRQMLRDKCSETLILLRRHLLRRQLLRRHLLRRQFCPTLAKGSKWHTIQTWVIDVFHNSHNELFFQAKFHAEH